MCNRSGLRHTTSTVIAIAIPPEKGEKLEWLTATFAIDSPHFDQPNANVSDFVNVMTGLHSFWIRKRLLHEGFAMEGVGYQVALWVEQSNWQPRRDGGT